MTGTILRLLRGLLAVALLALPAVALAEHDEDPKTDNIHDLGHDVALASLFNGPVDVHTDLAFWGDLAVQGNWTGFRLLDVSAPDKPVWLSVTDCEGDQGDVSVWGNLVIRSTNSPNTSDRECDGATMDAGFEGLHVFDISDVADPVLIATVPTGCGSHTHTTVPDLANDRLLIYNNSSSSACSYIELVEVPLGDPAAAASIDTVPLVDATFCHDAGAMQGDVDLLVCASTPEVNVFDISDPADPVLLYTITEPGVTTPWHSATLTWDGEVIVLGWEPGGGVAPSCEENDPDVKKSYFFYESLGGTKLGEWTLQRPQTALENCTLQNLNIVPMRSGDYVLVHGSYPSGTRMVDFTDPANPEEIFYFPTRRRSIP